MCTKIFVTDQSLSFNNYVTRRLVIGDNVLELTIIANKSNIIGISYNDSLSIHWYNVNNSSIQIFNICDPIILIKRLRALSKNVSKSIDKFLLEIFQ